jgi:hypothetical protein
MSLGPTVITWSMIVVSCILSLSLVWDADGNPNTDNLPQAVVSAEARSAAEADAHVEEGTLPFPASDTRDSAGLVGGLL